MGRLTLNVLLSFAQFEREVTAERIRDKIAASEAKGMWMGGIVPIGYHAEGRSLVAGTARSRAGAADLRALPGTRLGECGPRRTERRRHPDARAPASQRPRERRRRLFPRQALRNVQQSAVHRPHPARRPGVSRVAPCDHRRGPLGRRSAGPCHAPAEADTSARLERFKSARRTPIRSRGPEDAPEPRQQEGPPLSLLYQCSADRQQRRPRGARLAHPGGRT